MTNDQGAIYAAFVDEQLRAESARRTSLDERGAKLQQSASVTVGLFATAIGLLLGKDHTLAGWPLGLFVGSIVVLIGAFLCGVVSTKLVTYEVADGGTFAGMLGDHWGDSDVDSRNITGWINAKTVTAMRPGNDFKAAWLSYGIWAQGAGVLLGAVAFVLVAAGSLLLGTAAPGAAVPTPQASASLVVTASSTATP